MANEFKVKKGLIVDGNTNINGELTTSINISSPNISADYYFGDGSNLYNTPAGAVFITNIEPQNPLIENVGDKIFTSNGVVLSSCVTTTDLIRVSALALPGYSNYKPVVSISGIEINLSNTPGIPQFEGVIDIDLMGSTKLTIDHEDHISYSVNLIKDFRPIVQSATFTGGYPGAQTELKENDTYTLSVTSNEQIHTVEIDDSGAFKASTHNISSPATIVTVVGTVANRGVIAQDLPARVRVQKSTGAWSDWFLTNSTGSTDGIHTVKLNNVYPYITTTNNIVYPPGQSAIKSGDTASIPLLMNNFNLAVYSSPTNELTVPGDTINPSGNTISFSKDVSYNSGSYNVSTNNFRITCTRNANNAVTTYNTIIRIANETPTINITIDGSPARLRSGGNDGTSAQNYTVRVTSNQQLYNAPLLSVGAGGGAFLNAFTGGPSVWTRTLQIHDNDPKGSYLFNSLTATGLAGIEQSNINSGASYILGGFVSRQITLPAFANEIQMNVPVTTYNKVVLSWSFDSTVNTRVPVDSVPPIPDAWCLLSPIDTSPVAIRIVDKVSADASSQASIVTIEETV